MKKLDSNRESGQTLVLVALALIVLLGALVLSVDVGNAYQKRRAMQNAADAGALAGARAYCAKDSRMAPLAEADRVAKLNGAGSTQIPAITNNIVTVTAFTTTKTFVAGIFNRNMITVSAKAQAKCGATTQACGVWPVAYAVQDYIENGINRTGWSSIQQCDDAYIWDDVNKDINCSYYSCDVDGDGKRDVIDGGARGWLSFPCPAPSPYTAFDQCSNAGGNACLKCRVGYGYPGVVKINQCLPAETGDIASTVAATGAYPAYDNTFWLPLYDTVCDPDGTGRRGYHVINFGCIKNRGPIDVCLWPTSDGCPARPSGSITKQGCSFKKNDYPKCAADPLWVSVIHVWKECGSCYAGCTNAGGGFPGPGDVAGISLISTEP